MYHITKVFLIYETPCTQPKFQFHVNGFFDGCAAVLKRLCFLKLKFCSHTNFCFFLPFNVCVDKTSCWLLESRCINFSLVTTMI